MNTGTITEVIGPVVDVHFEKDRPAIQDALVIDGNDLHPRITLEVASHIGLDRVRCISMTETAGLLARRKRLQLALRSPFLWARLRSDVCLTCSARPWTAKDAIPPSEPRLPIHRQPPAFDEQTTKGRDL